MNWDKKYPEWTAFSENMARELPPILRSILDERSQQDTKWGLSTERKDVSLAIWNAALVEEVGEVAKALLELRSFVRYWTKKDPQAVESTASSQLRDEIRAELIQVAALAWAMVEAVDSGSPVEL